VVRFSALPDLTARQLQTIVAVAEYSSFIAAAAELRTSQPAVTRTVKHVEEVLGLKLFDRSTRSVQITAAGKEFVGVASRILNDLRITIGSMRELADQRRGQVAVSSLMSVSSARLPGIISTYRIKYPGIELHVREGVHGVVLEDVRSGAVDFGITYLGDLPSTFSYTVIGREDFVVVLPSSHRLARKKDLGFAELSDEPLVSLPTDSRTRRVIDGAASTVGLALNHVATVSQFATMLSFVRAGIGLAIAPRGGVSGSLDATLVAVPLRGRPLTRDLGIVVLKHRESSPAAQGLMALIRQSWAAPPGRPAPKSAKRGATS
jgi:DNA-binding transcriptional LysR family regulator